MAVIITKKNYYKEKGGKTFWRLMIKKLECFLMRMERQFVQDAEKDQQIEIFMYTGMEKNVKFVNHA